MRFLKKKFIESMMIILLIIASGNVLALEIPSDAEISRAVSSELFINATTPSYLIDVNTTEGIVTLTGTVNYILARDRAVKIAKSVKGVRAVINKIEVNVPERNDENLEKDIKEALLNDPATESYEIIVNADNGQVYLTGNVESWQEKQLAAYVAKSVRGVKELVNNISVFHKTDRPDSEIVAEIKQLLKNDVRIDDGLIDVRVSNGEVSLSGVVGSANEKTLAFSKSWIAGVSSVDDSELQIKTWARDKNLRKDKYIPKTDLQIKEAVEDAFLYDPRVISFNPDVFVQNGVVSLTGEVDNLKAKQAAEQDARNVVGVLSVKNFLKVRPAFIPEDDDLEATVSSKLLKDPVVEKWEIDVSAYNGVVYLNGAVDSYFEKNVAEDIASRIRGVIAVQNNLKVLDDNDYYYDNYLGWNTYYPPYHVDIETGYKRDVEIRNNIEEQLWWSPYVNENEVDVFVSNGKAVLEGTVDTKREKLMAEINALEGGATEVDNNLAVDFRK